MLELVGAGAQKFSPTASRGRRLSNRCPGNTGHLALAVSWSRFTSSALISLTAALPCILRFAVLVSTVNLPTAKQVT
jgi:hypothetical protein